MPAKNKAAGAARALIADDPTLADFAAPFPRVRGKAKDDVEAGLRRMADGLGRLKSAAVVQLTLTQGQRRTHRCVGITPAGAEVGDYEVENPDLEILTSTKEWQRIASGETSPLEAFLGGRLRVRGDLGLARRLSRRLRRAPRRGGKRKKS